MHYINTCHLIRARQLLRTAVLISVFLIPTQLLAQSAVLDMTNSPSSQGWTTVTSGGGSSNWVPGLLTLDSPLNALSVHRAPPALWGATVIDPSGFEIEANIRVVAYSETSSAVAGLYFRNGIHYCLFDIYTDHIAFNGSWTGTTSYAMDTTDGFHQYILSGTGTHVDVHVDGNLVLSGDNLSGSTVAPHLDFGDGYWANDTTTEWNYVAFGPLGAVSTESETWGGVKALFR